MNKYIDILNHIIGDLKKSSFIEITRNNIAEGHDHDYVVNYLKNIGWKASQDYIDFCSSVDFADIEWEVRSNFINTLFLEKSMCTTGKIGISSFEYVLSEDFWLNRIWHEFNNVHHINIKSRLILIDYFESDISGCICLEAADKTIGSELHYFDHQIGNYPLGISFNEYFLKMKKSRGIYGWQRALSGKSTKYHKQVSFALEKLFP